MDDPIGKTSLLDSIIYGILGPPENMLTDQQRAAQASSRNNAGSMAKSSASDPVSMASGYMGPQSGGGSSFAQSLGTVGKIVKGFAGFI